MFSKKWAVLAGVLLLAGVSASSIFLQQRNKARQNLRESLGQMDKKQAELEGVQTELKQSITNLETFERDLVSAQEKIDNLSSERNHLKEERNILTSRIKGLEDEDAKKTNTITILKQEVEERDGKITSLDMKNQILSDKMAVSKAQFAESQDLLSERKAEINKLNENLAVEKELVHELEARLKEVNAERGTLITQSTFLKEENGNLRKRMMEMEARHLETLEGRGDKIASLSSALKANDERITDMENDKRILVSKLKEANRTIIGLKDQLQEVITQVPSLKDRLEKSMEKYQAVHENLLDAKAQQAKLVAQQEIMRETYEALVARLKNQLDSQEATIEEFREKLKVTFVDRILFGFSQVQISPEGKAALNQLAGVFANIPNVKISIIGHADSVPVASKFHYRFPSNWELSSARAASVTRYLLKKGGLEPSRIEVVGRSSYRPVANNDTKQGRAKNRRVEIILTPDQHQ